MTGEPAGTIKVVEDADGARSWSVLCVDCAVVVAGRPAGDRRPERLSLSEAITVAWTHNADVHAGGFAITLPAGGR